MREPKKLKFSPEELESPKQKIREKSGELIENLQAAAKAEGFSSRVTAKPKIDGRSLRKTNRNFQLNISVSAETKDLFWEKASSSGATSGGEFLEFLLKGTTN